MNNPHARATTSSPRERPPHLRALSIQARLAMLTALLCALVMVGVSVALLGMGEATDRTNHNGTGNGIVGPPFDANGALRVTMIEAQSALRGDQLSVSAGRSGAGAAGPAKEADDVLLRDDQVESTVAGQLARLDDAVATATHPADSQVRSGLEANAAAQRDAVAAWWEYARRSRAGRTLTADALMDDDRRFSVFERENDAMSGRISLMQVSVHEEMHDMITATQRQMMVATGIVLAVAALFGWWTMRDLTVPLRRLRDTLRAQRSGNRHAWAQEKIGTREVRELAAGLNSLTACQHALADQQRYALQLSRTTQELSRRIHDAADVESAFVMAAQDIGRELTVGQVLCLVAHVAGDERGVCAVWTPQQGANLNRVDDDPLCTAGEDVAQLWAGERCLVVEDTAGITIPSAAPAEFDVDANACILALFGEGDRPRGVVSIRTLDGPRAWTQAESTFVQQIAAELGRSVFAVEMSRARTEHVARLEELDREKDTFLSTVSHELRTPLTSMSGYLEMLEDGDAGQLTDEQKRMLSAIDRNAVRLRDLIEDLLFFNPHRAALDRFTDNVPLDALVARTCAELGPLAQARGVILDTGRLSGRAVLGQRTQLGRALANIVGNAVKFTGAGGRVWVSTAEVPGERTVRLVCCDEGMGIPQAEQSRLFTRFFRASNATKNEIPGTGLGLVVVRGIVDAHGGTLSLSSVEDVGTTVVMELPSCDERGAGVVLLTARDGGSERTQNP